MRFFLVFLLMTNFAAASSARIEFIPTSMLPMGDVLLRDVANITGDSAVVSRIGQLKVTELGHPGQVRRIGTATLRDFYILPLAGSDTLEFGAMISLELRAKAGQINRDSLEVLIREALLPQLANLEAGSWELDLKRLPAKVDVPEGNKWQPEIALLGTFDARGQQIVEFSAMDGDKEIVHQRMMVDIRRFTQAAFSTREIQKGEKLLAADIRFERIEVTGVLRQVFPDMASLAGRQATRTIPRDRMISQMMVDKPFVVRRGDRVMVSARLASGAISVPAEVEQDGTRGQVVALHNVESGLKMSARIAEDGSLWAMP